MKPPRNFEKGEDKIKCRSLDQYYNVHEIKCAAGLEECISNRMTTYNCSTSSGDEKKQSKRSM